MQKTKSREIADELEDRIRRGVYRAGECLPSRPELTAEFGSARNTLDRAVELLTTRGRVCGRRGSGTRILPWREKRKRLAVVWKEYPGSLPAGAEWVPIPSETVAARSEWNRLLEFDGVLFHLPESRMLPLIAEIRKNLPTAVVNRILPDTPYAAYDTRTASREITRERLAAHPECRAFFLRSGLDSLALDYRREGFVDACREAKKFYEILTLPLDFAGRSEELEKRLRLESGHPPIIVSDALRNTGAVLEWGRRKGVRWGMDAWYSDFDNEYPDDVWGIRVTSFRQDLNRLCARAAEMLLNELDSGIPAVPILLPPFRRNGET